MRERRIDILRSVIMQRLHELERIDAVGQDTTFAIESVDFSPHLLRGEAEIGGKTDADGTAEIAGAVVTVSARSASGLAVKAAEPIELVDVALGDVTEV
jgi:hypothetical protein